MRCPASSFVALLVVGVVTRVALADVTAPEARVPTELEYVGPLADSKTPAPWEFTEYEKGAVVYLRGEDRAVEVLGPSDSAVVGERHDRFYRVRNVGGAGEAFRVFGGALTPWRLVVGGRVVTVGFDGDYKIHVHVIGGGELVLDPAGQGYLSQRGGNVSAELVDARVAGMPLLLLSSRPHACADFWQIYVSVENGVPRNALELDGLVDPPTHQEAHVKFDPRTRSAVVTTETDTGEIKPKRTRERFMWKEGVFVNVSKRADKESK